MKAVGKQKKKATKTVKKEKSVKSYPEIAPLSDKVWVGKEDARTLAEAEKIISDPKRKKEAIKQAKQMAHDKIQEAKAMLHVADKDHVVKPKMAKKQGKKEAAFSE